MSALRRFSLSLAVAAVIVGLAHAASPAAPRVPRLGPPWVSIEYPVNPYDASARGAYLLVHVFHHGTPTASPLSGTAEGVVNGERKSVALRFDATSRPGVFALRKQWDNAGVWDLVISVEEHGDNMAQALVELAADGGVASVRVPTREERDWTIPRRLTAQEIEASLRTRAVRSAEARR